MNLKEENKTCLALIFIVACFIALLVIVYVERGNTLTTNIEKYASCVKAGASEDWCAVNSNTTDYVELRSLIQGGK